MLIKTEKASHAYPYDDISGHRVNVGFGVVLGMWAGSLPKTLDTAGKPW
jgi:hypothetical protein